MGRYWRHGGTTAFLRPAAMLLFSVQLLSAPAGVLAAEVPDASGEYAAAMTSMRMAAQSILASGLLCGKHLSPTDPEADRKNVLDYIGRSSFTEAEKEALRKEFLTDYDRV